VKNLVETIVRGLVEHGDEVLVTEERQGTFVTFDVQVAETDRGNVIGRGGSTATALRTLVSGVARRHDLRVEIHIRD